MNDQPTVRHRGEHIYIIDSHGADVAILDDIQALEFSQKLMAASLAADRVRAARVNAELERDVSQIVGAAVLP